MYSEFNLLSSMGTSNCGLFFSDKDLNTMEFNSISKPRSEFQERTHVDVDHQLQEQEQEEKGETLVSSLRIKTPSIGEFKVDDDDNGGEGCRTPTCLDQRIPLIPQCPAAPRKPKKQSLMKRKAASRRQTLLDLSSEVEALFPPSLLVDLGGKIKKVRIANGTK